MKVVPRKTCVLCTYRFSSFPRAEDEGRFFMPASTPAKNTQLHIIHALMGRVTARLHTESGRLVESPYVANREKDPDAASRNRCRARVDLAGKPPLAGSTRSPSRG